MILESNETAKPWKRVAKPSPKFSSQTTTRILSKPPAPPVSPKPGGKVHRYVYDNEPESASVPQYYKNPHFTRQESLESDARYHYEKEKKQQGKKQNSLHQTPQQGRTGRERVRDQGRRSNKGYKVLAEVTPNLRSSSRGGRMFVKQRQRMDEFTKESQKQQQDENQNYGNRNDFTEGGVTNAWATPRNTATKPPASVQYITSKKLAGNIDPVRQVIDPLSFMPRPPDYWRAKVEQNFPNGPMASLRVRPRSIERYRSRWDPSTEINERPDSAPPTESPTYDDDAGYDPNAIYDENHGDYSQYGIPPRPASVALPSATLHFNAKQYYTAPHRRQGLRQGWDVYTTVPYANSDFNARPKGWHRHY